MIMTRRCAESVMGGPDPIDVEVGINMRQARRAKGMSQTELGEALGVSFQQVQKYERGANRVCASVLVKAAQSLGVSVMDLLPPGTQAGRSLTMLDRLATVRGADLLVDAYTRIACPKTRRAGLGLIVALAAATEIEGSEIGEDPEEYN